MRDRKAFWGITTFVVFALLCSSALWSLRFPDIAIPPRQYPPNNAYDAYKKLAEQMQKDLDRDPNFRWIETRLANEQSRDSVSEAEKAYYIKRISPYLETYRQYLDQPSVAVYEYDWGWVFRECVEFRRLARAESFMIRRALEHNQPKEAVARAAALTRFAVQTGNEGAPVQYFNSLTIVRFALYPLRESFASINDTAALQAIVELARWYEKEHLHPSRMIEQHYYFGLSVYRDLHSGKMQLSEIQSFVPTPPKNPLEEWLYNTNWGKSYILKISFHEYIRLYNLLHAEMNKPSWERKTINQEPRRYLNQAILWWYNDEISKDAIELATMRLLGCAAAVKLYRLRTGQYPHSLDVLQLGEMAIDPFTGNSFIYRYDAQAGFQLYSVGLDRVDNGGCIGQDDSTGDITPVVLPASSRPVIPGMLSVPVWIR